MTCPCRGCPFREVGCHGRCEIYRDWVREFRERKDTYRGEKEARDYEAKNQFFRREGPKGR